MMIPEIVAQTDDELRSERDEVVARMHPFTVEQLQRLRDLTAIEYDYEALLDHYESLTWLLGED